MKKILMIGTSVLSLAACGGSDGTDEASVATPEPSALMQTVELAQIDLSAQIERGRIPGAAYKVVKGGETEVLFLGQEGADDPDPVNGDTIFRIYSMTKPVVSVAAMTLIEDGRLSLDTEVREIIPELDGLQVMGENGELRPASRPITVYDLMTHTSGLIYGQYAQSPNPVQAAYAESDPSDYFITSDQMIDRISGLPLMFDPGDAWHYSVSTDVLGEVVARVSGGTLEEYLSDEIFEPLGMEDTSFSVDEGDLDRLASDNDFPLIGPDAKPLRQSGGGGLFSTLDDYSRFADMLLGKGAHEDVQILEPETFDMMLKDVFASGEVSRQYQITKGAGFGLGFGLAPAPAGNSSADTPTFYWAGYSGPHFWVDPGNNLYSIFLIQNPDMMMEYNMKARSWVYGPMMSSASEE